MIEKLSEEQRKSIQAVAMDMWTAYMNAIENKLPASDIVHDKFHVAICGKLDMYPQKSR